MESSYFRISHVIIVFLPHRAMSNRYKTVVQGEASETDSDDEVYITSMPPPQAALVGLKVSGEASETDSDGDEEQLDQTSTSSQQSSLILQRDLPPLIVVQDRPDIQSVVEDRPSPTHRPHGEMVRQLYSSASKEVHSATAQLNASQGAIINASHSIRIILDDLKAVSEKIDIITSCQILPDINITN
ncbi:biogenesis of lysosome-related organelles complex 1 subunit 3 isoform X3 [Takifugu rubripes]|uniref:biogenesis of lysosome-related organelles complex 1 subunit 3 isoform X3 n=1 Tax=Takifugu rubripes TaxID=31033 RepID=UPI0005D18BC1|nr:biogenesis of lysosome-related organelles complex 1 subunit 3 isoform X3 [Takifugu rubripes]XP_056905830.1 biogenesis of lysosome-related organelles complex 1 subunit 3 isoform X3 [Takifugu flavidus]|eukprot:XP_011616447.1 PREDICTED: biogenesis of lysosome-related organelles complex 1 subunit 3 isoform X2 [Takifugu rubripes]